MANFFEHEGQDTILVRGSMAHSAMTVSEFEKWLAYEDCTRTHWIDSANMQIKICRINRKDGSHRSTAMRLYAGDFPA